MGCATSKQQPVCRNCQEPLSPMPRSYSMHVHHLPQHEGDTYHVVGLTSTTLGSLKLDTFTQNHHINKGHINAPIDDKTDDNDPEKINKEFSMGMIEVAPKTPIQTPPGEPETINAWELMEGLEDTSPVHHHHHFRTFTFNFGPNSVPSSMDHHPTPKVQENSERSPRPLWPEMADNDNSKTNSNATSIVSEFDPDVITEFRKSLDDLPPANPFHLKPLVNEKQQQALALGCNNEALDVTDYSKNYKYELRAKDKVVLYFTSLRGVRKTYEDCCHVRVILKGLGVRVDERDVSMHSGFKEELKELLGDGFSGGGLPRVFVGRMYVGGAEEIRRMNEEGKLEKVVESCEKVDDGGGGGCGDGRVCEGCGDVRFMPCETCSGSCKIYYEGDYDEEEYDEGECGFQRCPDCNENGLIRCPICCD